MAASLSKNYITINDVPALAQSHCKIKNPKHVENIINDFVNGGHKRIQVVSDFDYTITKQRTENGEMVLTSFGILHACKSLPPLYIEETDKLYHKYRPLEIDPKVPIEDKMKYMIEWWEKSANLMV